MECRRCAACDRAFRPRAQVPHQCYCGLAACQRERRRRWQQSKLRSDADYRANQRQAQRAWPTAMASTGVSTGLGIPTTPIITVLSSGGVTAADVWRVLQRWARHRR